MKKCTALILVVLLTAGLAGCTTSAPAPAKNPDETVENWDFYNKRAETFITEMAGGNFDGATELFDAQMTQLIPASSLQTDVWGTIVQQAGEYVSVYETENVVADGYYVCVITSRHEKGGVTLRIVFSKDGLISGLFIVDFPSLPEESAQEDDTPEAPMQQEGFADYPIVIGEGSAYPLNGILSIPSDGSAPVPAIVLVHGSGPQDMDETIFENKPFKDIAEYLAANGIAVLRYDKRTAAHGAKLMQELSGSLTVKEETVDDAILAVKLLKADPRIDANKVFILGHSLGGMLAPRIHAEGGNFAGIISLAGSPRSLLDISYDQQMAYIEEMPEGDERTNALAQMETYDEQVEALLQLTEAEAKAMPMQGGASFYYYKEMDAHPVSEYIKNMQIPFLILQGEKDFQVYANKDYVLWQELLEGRANATCKLYEGLNHLFMPSTGGSIAEYQEEYKIPGKVDGQVLDDILEWIKAN